MWFPCDPTELVPSLPTLSENGSYILTVAQSIKVVVIPFNKGFSDWDKYVKQQLLEEIPVLTSLVPLWTWHWFPIGACMKEHVFWRDPLWQFCLSISGEFDGHTLIVVTHFCKRLVLGDFLPVQWQLWLHGNGSQFQTSYGSDLRCYQQGFSWGQMCIQGASSQHQSNSLVSWLAHFYSNHSLLQLLSLLSPFPIPTSIPLANDYWLCFLDQAKCYYSQVLWLPWLQATLISGYFGEHLQSFQWIMSDLVTLLSRTLQWLPSWLLGLQI